jgi:hypothetical protein
LQISEGEIDMTKRQADKLGTIIAKLEALQAELPQSDNDTINQAKAGLIKLWSKHAR